MRSNILEHPVVVVVVVVVVVGKFLHCLENFT